MLPGGSGSVQVALRGPSDPGHAEGRSEGETKATADPQRQLQIELTQV